MTDLIERLENAADRFLKWTYKEPYSGPPVISIPRHPDNIDAILLEAASALRSKEQEIERLTNRVTMLRAEADGIGSLLLDVQRDCIAERKRAHTAEARVEELETKVRQLQAALEQLGYFDV